MGKGMQMMALEGLVEALTDAKGKKDELPASVQAKRLVAMYKLYQEHRKHCPFGPGDLVTPRDGVNFKGAGDPHIVLEVRADAEPQFSIGEPNSSGFGHRLNIRVACMHGEILTPFWMESWVLDKWEGNIAA